jgi:hypothetical protein
MTPAMNVGVCDQCGLPTARISSLCRAVARSASASAFAARRSARMIADAAPLAVSGCAEAIAMRSESGSSMNASRIRAREALIYPGQARWRAALAPRMIEA